MAEIIEYYRQRALVERSRAMDAPTPRIAAVHQELAKLYDDFIRMAEFGEGTQSAAAWPQAPEPPPAPEDN